jgi:AsmA protein
MKLLLRSLLFVVGVIFLLVILALALVLTLDPNHLKPLLQKEAAKHGVALHMPGDIRWRLFPSLGLSLGELELASLQDKTLLAAVNQAEVAVQLKPILQRQIRVDGVRLDGLEVHYEVDAQGNSAWQSLGKAQSAAPSDPGPDNNDGASLPALSVEQVQITRLKLIYNNLQSGDRAEIRDFNLSANGLALAGAPFPLQMDFTAVWQDMAPVKLAWRGPVAVDLERQQLTAADAQVDVRIGEGKLALRLSTDTHWGEPLTSRGQVELSPAALPPLLRALGVTPPETASPQALNQFGGTLTYDFSPDQLSLDPVALTLDKTRLNGRLSLKNFAAPAIVTQWQGTHLVLDDYLPPKAESTAAASPEAQPQPLPLEALRALDLDAKVVFESLTYDGLVMSQPQVQLQAQNGVLKLQDLRLSVAEGQVSGRGQLDARGKEAVLNMDVVSQGVDLGMLLQKFAELDKISGKVNAMATITSHGATDVALKDNLVVEATAESQELRLVPVNIEEQFCRAIAILQQQELPADFSWPEMTRLEPVQMQVRFAQNTLNLQQLSASIAHLLGAASGTFNLDSGKFNIPLSVSLGDFAGGVAGCLPIEEKWRKRALPIRCKGSVDDIGIKTCLPDTQLLADMLKDKLKDQTKEKLEEEKDRLEDKLEDKARQLLQEKVGEEKTKSTEDSVRDLLKQIRKK